MVQSAESAASAASGVARRRETSDHSSYRLQSVPSYSNSNVNQPDSNPTQTDTTGTATTTLSYTVT